MIEKIEKLLKKIKSSADALETQQLIFRIRVEIKNLQDYLNHVISEIEEVEKTHSLPKHVVKRLLVSPVDIQTMIDEGWRYINQGRYQDAIKVLRKTKKLAPMHIRVYILLGWAYIHLERYDEAMAVYQQALNIDPENQLVRANLGYISYKLGIYGEAIEKLSRIIKTIKDREALMYAHMYLGLVYYDREMYDDAIEFLEKAIKMAPNLFEAHFFLGLSLIQKGEKEKGKEILTKLSNHRPENIWSTRAREVLNG